MALFSHNNLQGGSQQSLTTTFKSILGVNAATGATTLRRAWIEELEVGADGLPNATDCQIVWDWSRMTAAGTGTAQAPNPLEAADAAALCTYTVNYTAEPTVTAGSSILAFAANQRASQRWFAKDNREALIVPATNLAGIVMRAKSTTYASTVVGQHYVRE